MDKEKMKALAAGIAKDLNRSEDRGALISTPYQNHS